MTQANYSNDKQKKPVLFLIFNRVDEAIQVFEEIKRMKPKELFIASDGPRLENVQDYLNNSRIKEYIESNLNWDVKVEYLYREINIGCREAVSSAISWFFSHVDEGIILEDDCLPNPDFFRFCAEMLDKYRDVETIGHICGCNFQDRIKRGDGDYYFSRLTHVWGWASWKSRWKMYDITMDGLEEFIKNDGFSTITNRFKNKKFLSSSYKMTSRSEIDTWDYQYAFTNLKNGKLSIIPNFNLISNIGFNKNSTHTSDENSTQSNIAHAHLPIKLKSPTLLKADFKADCYTIDKEIPSYFFLVKMLVYNFIKGLIKKL